jgi:hypothetical protein
MRSNFRSSASALSFSAGVMTSIWACDGGMASKPRQWLDLTVWQPTRATKQIAQNVNLRRYIARIALPRWICYGSSMQNIDKLRLEMPLVFELIAVLNRDRAKLMDDFMRLRERLESHEELSTSDHIQRRIQEGYRNFRLSEEPIRRELDYITKKIVDIIAMMPPEPIILPASAARHLPVRAT